MNSWAPGMSHTQLCLSGRWAFSCSVTNLQVCQWYICAHPGKQSKKDVTITYVRKPPTSSEQVTQFDDIVEYRGRSDQVTSKRSKVVGIDTLLLPPISTSAVLDPQSVHPPQTRFKWRGKGWLIIASSRWQVLGCDDGRDDGTDSTTGVDVRPAWALTYFEKTLFTPAGLDIYARSAQGLPEGLLQEIINKAKALGGEVGLLADQFFEVERSVTNDAHPDVQRIGPINKTDVLNHVALTPS
ncbi:hypothetical protein AcW1_009056 [Taiwanofungus camphoratus]|nr:hypothetical protein AcV5_007078 [Antrodia cinnamomea]KAI0949442.1 hypothetical protein AcW1_009056 [Antrodia cinnamomea]